jgi:serine O-acetyltransferase
MNEFVKLPSNTTNTTLGIGEIVQELRMIRLESLKHRQRRNKSPKLPSRRILQSVIESLSAALFPNRLGLPDLKEEDVEYFVGHHLDTALRDLLGQIKLELHFSVDTASSKQPSDEVAIQEFEPLFTTVSHTSCICWGCSW